MTRDDLISHIETAAERHGIAPATVTSRAVGNSRLYRRLKLGKGCTLDVAARIVAWVAKADAKPPAAGKADDAA